MKKTKVLASIITASLFITALAGCSRSATGSKEADNGVKAFNSIVKAYPDNKGFHKALSHWGFKLESGEKFEWTKDTSANSVDLAMVMPADPFIKAGLDVTKLDQNEWVFKPAGKEDGMENPNLLIRPYNVSDKKEDSDGSEDAMRRVIKQNPKLLTYHADLKHYRLSLGEGFEAQWTEQLGINDADMIFVIKADPLVKAGLDIKKLEGTGWVYREASKDNMGMGENPNQLVKIFKIKK